MDLNDMLIGITCHLRPNCTLAFLLSESWIRTGEGTACRIVHVRYFVDVLVSSCECELLVKARIRSVVINIFRKFVKFGNSCYFFKFSMQT